MARQWTGRRGSAVRAGCQLDRGRPAIAGYLRAISSLPARVNIFIRRAFHDLREPE
jgi:hypothetical protein